MQQTDRPISQRLRERGTANSIKRVDLRLTAIIDEYDIEKDPRRSRVVVHRLNGPTNTRLQVIL